MSYALLSRKNVNELALKERAIKLGAVKSGISQNVYANITGDGYRSCLIFAVALNPGIVRKNRDKPTLDFVNEFNRANRLIHQIERSICDGLLSAGISALSLRDFAQARKAIVPLKRLAVKAGIGWMGKSTLIVTEEYGPAIRLGGVAIAQELVSDIEILESKCGTCLICTNSCPGDCIRGVEWKAKLEPKDLLDIERCKETNGRLTADALGIEATMCSTCMSVCKYISRTQSMGLVGPR